MFSVFLQSMAYPKAFFFCVLLAFIPAFVWFLIFSRKHPQKKKAVLNTFLLGILSAVLVLGYQSLWGTDLNFVYFKVEAVNFQENWRTVVSHSLLSSFFVYMSVGFLEEYAKHIVVAKADRKYFTSVDDVIELSIVAALGFSFLENIGYFFSLILQGQQENLFALFFMRSIFVVFIHILCSGIYGAFYGMGYFARPYMEESIAEGKKFYIAEIFYRLFHWRKTSFFREQMMMQGLIVSSVIHGIYDFLLTPFFSGIKIFDIPFYYFVLSSYFCIGLIYLSSLIDKKENHERFGHLLIQEEYVPDVQDIIRRRGKRKSEKKIKIDGSTLLAQN